MATKKSSTTDHFLSRMDLRYDSGRTSGSKIPHSQNYNIIRHKGNTIAIVMATLPPNIMFKRDLISSQLVAWNALLQRLALVQLTPGTDEFRLNLHTNRRFSIDSMYKALILPKLPVDINKMILKMNIPLKTKIIGWYLHRGVILTKDNLVKRIGRE
jgi:hypothetical protein